MEEGTVEFIFIGWCKEEKNGIKSDKVWAAFKAGDTYYATWGARGKKLSFKNHGTSQHTTLDQIIRKKKMTYEEVDPFYLFTVFPYFQNEVEQHLMMSLLTNTVK